VRWRAQTIVQRHGALRARRPQLKRDPLDSAVKIMIRELALLMVALPGALAGQRPFTLPGDSLVPGTYTIRICRASCDSPTDSTVLVVGTVVLLPKPVPRRLISSPIHADYYHPYLNACFDLKKVRLSAYTHAGLFPSGMVGWDRDPRDSLVQFSLYWSPDARYWVKVRATGTELRGHGQSQGFGSGPAVDSVYGWRVGPPDQAKCIAAAKE